MLTQDQVDGIRGKPGHGRVNVALYFESHEFRTSISIYRGEWMFVVNKAMRAAGMHPGRSYPVDLVRDHQPKRAEPALDVVSALATSPLIQAAWDQLTTSRQREHLKHIEEAKRMETRARRIAKLIDVLSVDHNPTTPRPKSEDDD